MNLTTAQRKEAKARWAVQRLSRCLGFGLLLLIGTTWRLWTPQTEFPRVPLLPVLVPDFLQWMTLAVVLAGALGFIGSRSAWALRISAGMLLGGLGLQFLADQHRLQPWAWQFWLLAWLAIFADALTLRRGWRWLVISIYFWSAVSKFDAVYLYETGGHLLETVWLRWWQAAPPPWFIALMPVAELLLAICLIIPKFQRWGVTASWIMHASLIGLLGPWAADHSLGVLAWNLYMMFQNFWLFREPTDEHILVFTVAANTEPEPESDDTDWATERLPLRTRVLNAAITVACLWPVAVWFGGCDAWLGWAVYTPPRQQVLIWIPRDQIGKLPAAAQTSLRDPELRDIASVGEAGWQSQIVNPNAWSLSALDVPSYPGTRFRIAAARGLCLSGVDGVTVSISDWRMPWQTYAKRTRVVRGCEELEQEAARYFWNTRPATPVASSHLHPRDAIDE